MKVLSRKEKNIFLRALNYSKDVRLAIFRQYKFRFLRKKIEVWDLVKPKDCEGYTEKDIQEVFSNGIKDNVVFVKVDGCFPYALLFWAFFRLDDDMNEIVFKNEKEKEEFQLLMEKNIVKRRW